MNLPNKLTLVRMVMVPVFIACFYLPDVISWWNYAAAAIFLLADLTDVLDGYIARKHNLITDFGKLMDPMADKLLFCSAFIMLTALDGPIGGLNPILTIIFIGRELIISAFRLVAASSGTVIAANWLGKAKSAVQVIAIMAMLLGNPIFNLINIRFDLILMYLAGILTVWSAADYIIKNKGAINWK